jgi:hypothetical protein
MEHQKKKSEKPLIIKKIYALVCSNDKLRKLITRDYKRLKDNGGPWTDLGMTNFAYG